MNRPYAKKKSSKKLKSKNNKSNFSLKEKLLNWLEDQSVAYRFLGTFILLISTFYAFYFSTFNITKVHPVILNAQANVGAFLINIFDSSVHANGGRIQGNGFFMNVSGGCDGLEVTALLVASILAFPSTWHEKKQGLVKGILVLTILNILRLPVLYFAGAKVSKSVFDFLHIQGGFILFISISMFIWGKWIIDILNQRNQNQPPIAPRV